MSTLAYLLAGILLPPFCFIAAALIGLALAKRRPRFGTRLAAVSLAMLWVVSTAAFNYPFLTALAWPAAADLGADSGAQAIIVLGGGTTRKAPEYRGADTLNARTLNRVRYAAWLSKQTQLPVLASGGAVSPGQPIESELMKAVLENELGTSVRWIETASRNTFENARGSAQILRREGITRAFLVTHSGHMRRAVDAFAAAGFAVVPAPIEVFEPDPLTWADFVPGPVGFQTSHAVAHELLGRAWYWLRARFA